MRPSRAVALVLAPACAVILVAGCSTSPAGDTAPCGWDLTTAAGQAANAEHLTATLEWLADHPGQVAPAPTSTFWRGECPSTGPAPEPPIHEDDHPGE